MKTEDKAIQLLRDLVLSVDNNELVNRDFIVSTQHPFYSRAVKVIAEEITKRGKHT